MERLLNKFVTNAFLRTGGDRQEYSFALDYFFVMIP